MVSDIDARIMPWNTGIAHISFTGIKCSIGLPRYSVGRESSPQIWNKILTILWRKLRNSSLYKCCSRNFVAGLSLNRTCWTAFDSQLGGREICPKHDYCFKPIFAKKDISSPQKIHCFLRGSVVDYTLTHGSTENARQETTAQCCRVLKTRHKPLCTAKRTLSTTLVNVSVVVGSLHVHGLYTYIKPDIIRINTTI